MSNCPYEFNEESIQDVFIMRPNGKIAYLPYSVYSDLSRIIESVEVNGDAQRFFLNKDGSYPFNLAGPTVTKVIDWNLQTDEGEPKVHPKQSDVTPQAGYFLDLRRMSMDRLSMIFIGEEPNYPADQAVTDLPRSDSGYQLVPEAFQHQLKETPEQDHLYLAFFNHPNKTRSINQFYSYSVAYITAEELDKWEYSAELLGKLADGHEGLEPNVDFTTKHLETYYGETGVQATALSPMDLEGSPLAMACLTCYVANLRTFKG
ncbi:hypothetical protein [Marinomonas mediterranea]|jgi:hypothetical protein|uniref:Uncharacterized protein n=1 Tax=Marinomonas mediterranea (strain ATCC 700492 / JCM 21426 / NBRC 103028 / MMB-1) TaxID=717774 RepID=F2JU64_MARM1|nr:hypothetical protein [Marinomonas mediterranea]ADZ91576.1 hypothetical protein Marme_2335 [Marinomonas mediterranea MMB-1]WCN17680.1 hypothetical protein GV053_11795 [Marinomonas mediterranea MMB-1]